VEIRSINGVLVKQGTVKPGSSFSVQDLLPGIYLLELNNTCQSLTEKIVIW
jgi:hypothetical protein